MAWDREYSRNKRIWGEGPSELGKAAVSYLLKNKSKIGTSSILDIGCGYGRDAFYLRDNLECKILGIDVSEKAVDIALATALQMKSQDVIFRCCNFMELKGSTYDIVLVSNLYQLLKEGERAELRKTIGRVLKSKGLLFLSTLSVNDPEHCDKGIPVPGESNSFQQDEKYLHLCTRKEIVEDFAFLNVRELYEHEYFEPRSTGETHHHISWILIGERATG